MIAAVSASGSVYPRCTGVPTTMITSGGDVTFVMFGSLALRGHTFSVPQIPIGITGARVAAASLAAPHLPFRIGSKNARPRGMVPCGINATKSPALISSVAARNGSSLPVPRSTRIPPSADAIGPMTGASNTSFFPKNRTARPVFATARDTAAISK